MNITTTLIIVAIYAVIHIASYIAKESAKRKMTLNLPPLVPFGSRQWPTLVTPGPGAKTLADLP